MPALAERVGQDAEEAAIIVDDEDTSGVCHGIRNRGHRTHALVSVSTTRAMPIDAQSAVRSLVGVDTWVLAAPGRV
jgi:hypothetical protein